MKGIKRWREGAERAGEGSRRRIQMCHAQGPTPARDTSIVCCEHGVMTELSSWDLRLLPLGRKLFLFADTARQFKVIDTFWTSLFILP